AILGSAKPLSLTTPIVRIRLRLTKRTVAFPATARPEPSGERSQELNEANRSDREPDCRSVSGSSQMRRVTPCLKVTPSNGGREAPPEANAVGITNIAAAHANQAPRFITHMMTLPHHPSAASSVFERL